SSESFGFDTLRLKENNLRIHFDDTSSSASFPGNDWRLIATDSSNGGANYFAIEDATAGKTPFKVEAGAPANTLYVEDDGDVGVGTANPTVRMHLVKGDSPALRLEQDGSSGFTPQAWDVAGNETNFFIRDVTNGSKLPFRIKPGAPDDSIFVAASGNIGMGTDSPDLNLDIEGDGPGFRLTNTGTGTAQWDVIVNSTQGRLNFQVNGGNIPLKIDDGADNNLVQIGFDNSDEVTVNGDLILASGASCIQLRDSDDAGNTACTTLNGTLTCVAGDCP
ncbi:MAG: hypothetical protein GY929_05400, partial [Actinomycetia bacterium]|nr:hypothetical protein [Actinomycetes bacterium]